MIKKIVDQVPGTPIGPATRGILVNDAADPRGKPVRSHGGLETSK